MKTLNTTIRRGDRADATEIARVHLESWRDVYRGIMPAETLAAISLEDRELRWAGWFEAKADLSCWVAEDEGRLTGFATGGPERSGQHELDGELYAIYLLPSHHGRRIGTELFRRVIDDLAVQGHRSLFVWVLEENVGARRFYERMGGKQIVARPLEIHGEMYMSFGYAWTSLPSFPVAESGAVG